MNRPSSADGCHAGGRHVAWTPHINSGQIRCLIRDRISLSERARRWDLLATPLFVHSFSNTPVAVAVTVTTAVIDTVANTVTLDRKKIAAAPSTLRRTRWNVLKLWRRHLAVLCDTCAHTWPGTKGVGYSAIQQTPRETRQCRRALHCAPRTDTWYSHRGRLLSYTNWAPSWFREVA